VQRRYRLRSSTEITRVRQSGTSYAHPLLVLIVKAGESPISRFAVTAGRSIGKAVHRNRAKRLLRAALQEVIADIEPGYQGLLIARKPLLKASSKQASTALKELLKKAGIGPSNKHG
jgi:ribonuclease P protein component